MDDFDLILMALAILGQSIGLTFFVIRRRCEWDRWLGVMIFYVASTVFALTVFLLGLNEGDWFLQLAGAIQFGWMLHNVWRHWRRRPPRKQAERSVGEKAMALRAKLVAAMPKVHIPTTRPI